MSIPHPFSLPVSCRTWLAALKASLLGLVLLSTQCIAAVEDTPDSIFHSATGPAGNLALILLGGSEGGLPDYYDTNRLTAQGYPCLVAGYFRTRSTPAALELIPLEYFEKLIRDFRARPEVGNKRIVVWGGSKGGELALVLASHFPEIRGVIAAVPSSVVFQGIGGKRVSSWTSKGKELPFVPFPDYDWSKIVNAQYRKVYQLALEQREFVERASIEVEKIHGPILILSGKADSMWPSSVMGEMIVQRLSARHFKHWYRHYAYEDAGHTLNDSYMMGGTIEGNRKAKTDAALRIQEFLQILNQTNASSLTR